MSARRMASDRQRQCRPPCQPSLPPQRADAARRAQVDRLQPRQVVAGRVIAQPRGRLARHGRGGAQRLDAHRPARSGGQLGRRDQATGAASASCVAVDDRAAPPSPRTQQVRLAGAGAGRPRRPPRLGVEPGRQAGDADDRAARANGQALGQAHAHPQAGERARTDADRHALTASRALPLRSSSAGRRGSSSCAWRWPALQPSTRRSVPSGSARATDRSADAARWRRSPGRLQRRRRASAVGPSPCACQRRVRDRASAGSGSIDDLEPILAAASRRADRPTRRRSRPRPAARRTPRPPAPPPARQPIGVDVEEAQPAGVLVHEDEGGAVDDAPHAQPLGHALGQLRLARAERADQGQQRPGRRPRRGRAERRSRGARSPGRAARR